MSEHKLLEGKLLDLADECDSLRAEKEKTARQLERLVGAVKRMEGWIIDEAGREFADNDFDLGLIEQATKTGVEWRVLVAPILKEIEGGGLE